MTGNAEIVQPGLELFTWQALHAHGSYASYYERPPHAYRALRNEVERLARDHDAAWLLPSRPLAQGVIDLHDCDRFFVDLEDPWLELDWCPRVGRDSAVQ